MARRRGPGRRFRPGQSGNPAGRPKGAKDRIPRATVRRALEELIEEYRTGVRKLGKRARCNLFKEKLDELVQRQRSRDPETFLELAGRLFKELGATNGAQAPPTTIRFISNVDFRKLGGAPRAAADTRPALAEDPADQEEPEQAP